MRTFRNLTGLTLSVLLLPGYSGQGTQRTKRPQDREQQQGPGVPQTGPPDLVAVEPADGHLDSHNMVRYRVANRGPGPTVQPFVVNLLVSPGEDLRSDARKEMIRHGPMPGGSEQTVTSKTYAEECGRNSVAIWVDAEEAVAETSEDNNIREWEAWRPCPDLVITNIKQNWEDGNTRYRVQVTVRNQGDGRAWAPISLYVWTDPRAIPSPPPYKTILGSLNPGQSASVNASPKFLGTTRARVRVSVDAEKRVDEHDEGNNVATKTLGPH